MERIQGNGALVQVVEMNTPFAFLGRTYPAGSWLVLTPPRRALTAEEYRAEFQQTPPAPDWGAA